MCMEFYPPGAMEICMCMEFYPPGAMEKLHIVAQHCKSMLLLVSSPECGRRLNRLSRNFTNNFLGSGKCFGRGCNQIGGFWQSYKGCAIVTGEREYTRSCKLAS